MGYSTDLQQCVVQAETQPHGHDRVGRAFVRNAQPGWWCAARPLIRKADELLLDILSSSISGPAGRDPNRIALMERRSWLCFHMQGDVGITFRVLWWRF